MPSYGKKEPPYEPPELRVTLMTVDEACAEVDSWGSEQQFGLHWIARVLREEVRRLSDYKAIETLRAYEEYCLICRHDLGKKEPA